MVQKCAKPEFTERIELQCLRLKGIATRKDLLRSAQGASKSLAIGRDFPTASINSPEKLMNHPPQNKWRGKPNGKMLGEGSMVCDFVGERLPRDYIH